MASHVIALQEVERYSSGFRETADSHCCGYNQRVEPRTDVERFLSSQFGRQESDDFGLERISALMTESVGFELVTVGRKTARV